MALMIFPPDEVEVESWANVPINIDAVKSMRKLDVIALSRPGIQFHFAGGGATIEWAFVTNEDRNTCWTHILCNYGEQVG
jgi:hypothetical protein